MITDIFLRGCMDDQGFVPIHVIAGFKKVKCFLDVLSFMLASFTSLCLYLVNRILIFSMSKTFMSVLFHKFVWLIQRIKVNYPIGSLILFVTVYIKMKHACTYFQQMGYVLKIGDICYQLACIGKFHCECFLCSHRLCCIMFNLKKIWLISCSVGSTSVFFAFLFPSLNPSYYNTLLLCTVSRVLLLFSVNFDLCVVYFFLLLQVAELTDNIQQIVEALHGSPGVEVQVFLVYGPLVCKLLNNCLSSLVVW